MAKKDQMMLMKTKDAEAEKSAFEKLEQDFKSFVYGTIFYMLKTEDESLWRHILIIIIEGFQLFTLAFNPDLNFPWKCYSVTNYYIDFLQIFQTVYYASYLNFVSYLIVFYSGVFLVFIAVLDIIYISYSLSKKKIAFLWPLIGLRFMFTKYITVLYIPLLCKKY